MLKLFRKLFKRTALHPAFIPNTDQFKPVEDKVKKKIEKLNNTKQYYDDKLKSLLTLFAKNLSTDTAANKMYFETYNKEWLLIASKANRRGKLIKVNARAFENSAIALLNQLKSK